MQDLLALKTELRIAGGWILPVLLIFLSCGRVKSTHQSNSSTAKLPLDNKQLFRGASFDTGVNDTFFLVRNLSGGIYHAIYIDRFSGGEDRKFLTNFSPSGADSLQIQAFRDAAQIKYSDDWNYQKLPNRSASRQLLQELRDKQWLPVVQYQNNLYLYRPSEPGSAGKLEIRNDELVFWSLDGPIPMQIRSAEALSNRTLQILYAEPSNTRDAPALDTLRMHAPKWWSCAYLFEFVGETEPARYQLYVPRNEDRLGLIINFCASQRQPEYLFETPDYARWLDETLTRSSRRKP